MILLLNIYLYSILLVLVGMMVWQYLRGTHDLLSFRNIAIIGFCVFQLHSAALALRGHQRVDMMLQRPAETGLIFAVWVTVFGALFFWSYNRGSFVSRLAARIPTTSALPTTPLLWALAFGLIFLAAVFRFGINVYPFHQLGHIVGVTLAVASCGVAGWLWAHRFLNPVTALGVAAIVLSAIIVITTGMFGRRPLVAAGMAVLWGLYFSHFRYRSPALTLVHVGVLGFLALAMVAMWTTARDQDHRQRTGAEQLRLAIERGRVGEGIANLSAGQGAGGISLWLIEYFPENDLLPTRYFHSITYTAVFPVPRRLWPNKPLPLSVELPEMAKLQGVKRGAEGLTLGPGLMGHVAAEGRWLALIVYGIVGGLFIRLLDELTRQNAHSPLVVLALGSSFGQVIGFSRGETAAFLAWFILGVVGVYLTMLVLGKVLERISGQGAALYEQADDPYDDALLAHGYGADEPSRFSA